ncbi:putative disease resistance RPP13-like protein 2 [Amborella trichopoda]|uniref:putative disease resistance RPP13-like protein 2 n=1 Tax=Amborella trichopoda TaxID=13333 RepID=UPI0009BE9FBB|nr:putative disease resistance RPP13-like protein 2 [Amborella trichopoda]|eukprot:XP_020524332.1 putative disease resistance RPP13-like protein 2 [Amborella trichopoda]
MADPVVSFLLQKLDKLLTEEVQLLGGVKDDIQWIKDELQIMKPFLNDADKIRERDSVVDAWVAQVRDVVYDAEDVLDNFILRIANIKRRGFIAALDSFLKDNEEVLKGVEGMEKRELQQKLHTYLLDKKYVAVLDDVWRVVHVSFPNSENGSRFIITTRRGDVASPLYVRSEVYKLERLSTDDAWSLFFKKAFWLEDGNTCPMELEEEGRLIVQECDGLPLEIIVVGGMMSRRARCGLLRGSLKEGQVKSCRVHDMVRKRGLSLCEKEMFGAFDDKQDSKLDIRTRRLSIQNDDSSFYGEKNMSFLRTFFMFNASGSLTLPFVLCLIC